MKTGRIILKISQIIIGLTFIFSGFVKAVDPMGTMIKVDEYLIAFNMEWLKSISVVLAVLLCSYEFPLGVSILLGLKGRLMSWLLLLIMSFFTVLTFYLAIENPVSDCGCFGDAIKLTNWETFYKNIFLMIPTLIIFFKKNQIRPFLRAEWFFTFASLLAIILLCIFSLMYLPPIDFLPFKKGTDITEKMTIPPGKHGPVYETVLIYKNSETGKIQEFDIDNIPMDEKWQWQETRNKLVKKGYVPPIKDFIFTDSSGQNMAEKFLQQNGYKLLVIYHEIGEQDPNNQKKINELCKQINHDGNVTIYGITSTSNQLLGNFFKKWNPPYPIYHADIVLLEMMIRSNPGLILFKDNVIIAKWPWRKVPDWEKFSKTLYK